MKINKYIAGIAMMTLMCVSFTACKKDDKKADKIATSTDAIEQINVNGNQGAQQPMVNAQSDESGFVVVNDNVEVIGETVNVRVEPSTDSSIYMLLETGKVIRRTGYNEEWTRVNIDDTNFYVFSEFVAVTDKSVTDENRENPGEDDENTEQEQSEEKESKPKTIVIDPGNQINMIAATEPVGPGSTENKVGINTGAIGSAKGTAEYAINLTYALALKQELEQRGYTVTLTRETNDVNLTNKQRAELANATGATAFVRIKMNYSANSAMTGVMACTMTADSPYNGSLYSESTELATRILQGLTLWTGAQNHGIYETTGMTAINWSNIPVAVIALGYLSNEEEETKLLDSEYQSKVISGIADGIDLYYN